MGQLWIGLIVIAAAGLIWLAIFFGWAFLAWRVLKSGVDWDALTPEQGEFRPLARARRLRFRARR